MNNSERLLAIVWRAAGCHCEYWHRQGRPGGTLRLYQGEELVREAAVAGLDEMLQVSREWRQTLVALT